MSGFFIGKYAIAISTELSYVIRKKDVCEFHHVFTRDCESNQPRTDRMSRKVRLFVCYARMHVPYILKSMNTMYRYVNVSKHEHRSCIKVMCSCKNETHLANYHKYKLCKDIEKNPGPPSYVDPNKTIAAPYSQGNELLFGQNAGQQCIAMSLCSLIYNNTKGISTANDLIQIMILEICCTQVCHN